MIDYLKKLVNKKDLSEVEISEIFEAIIAGTVNSILIGAILTALTMKGETIEEILGVVKVMRKYMEKIKVDGEVIDTCGTGGDGARTINVSTIVSLLCATNGIKVAKHGNRSVSSQCGSFDVLEKLGVKIVMSKEKAKKCLEEINLTCLFAPLYHPAMKNIAPVRQQLGIRTIFNVIGPLLNPVGATHQLIGVYSEDIAKKLGEILMRLGSKKVLLVHSSDGLDEISMAAPTRVYEFVQGRKMKSYMVEPDGKYKLADVRGSGPDENARIMERILRGQGSDAQNEFVALNTAGAMLAVGSVESFSAGKAEAYKLLNSGAGLKKLEELIVCSNG